MPAILQTIVTLGVLTATPALFLDGKPDWLAAPHDSSEYSWVRGGDHIEDTASRDSKPGTPKIPDWKDDETIPVTGANFKGQWRADLGERLWKAASAHDSMEKCGSFISMGDFSWCKKGMPKEANPIYKKQFGGVHEYILDKQLSVDDAPTGDSFLALSFGVEETDCWSELMSGLYYVKSEIFDCYYSGENGPLVHDWHGGHSRSNPCQERHCYTEEYKKNRICLDDSSNVQGQITDTSGKQFQSLFVALEGRAPLSTFVKLDIEGSEWPTLERLLGNDEQLAKIRTLDMELHFNYEPQMAVKNKSSMNTILMAEPTKETLTHHVEIIEKLAEKFAVTGSTLEHYTEALVAGYNKERAKNPSYVASSPAHVYTKGGLNLNQFCISFINRKLL